jgi:hypothetical protein
MHAVVAVTNSATMARQSWKAGASHGIYATPFFMINNVIANNVDENTPTKYV